MRRIRAGRLRTPVYLGKPVIVKDNTGAESLTWTEFKTWALIEPLTGKEWLGPGAVKDSIDCLITMRITPGWEPTARWRVRDPNNSRIYSLHSALLIDAQGSVECPAKTVSGNVDGR